MQTTLPTPEPLAVTQLEQPRRKKFATYFIRHEGRGPIKIGKTRNKIGKRLAGMQSATWETLVCIAYIEGDCEAELHERFHHLCICGEWFRPEPELIDFIKADAIACNISRPPLSPETLKLIRDAKRMAARY